MAEEYADKMARKTDAELRQYVTGRAQYRDDAVLAAFDELTRRGQPHPDDALVRPELETVVRAQTEAAREAEARRLAEREAATEPEAANLPALYSQSTIAIFSLLPMSMIGGGVLLGMNLFRLGRKRAVLVLVAFMVLYLLVMGAVVQWAILRQGLDPFFASLLFNVPAILVYLRWFWPRYVQTEQYRSRSIIMPMLVSFAIVWSLQWGLERAMPYLIKRQPKEVQQQMEQLLKQ